LNPASPIPPSDASLARVAAGTDAANDSKPIRKLREVIVAARGEESASSEPIELITMEELERRYIARVMEVVRWNKSEAAKVLGFDRSTLYRKLERYALVSRKQAD
jgi:transcriptional regulator of acetoin/glycerol metabolism